MSGKTPAKRGGDWNGQHPAWSRPPFEEGNRCAVRHSLYLTKFSDEDRAEIAELAASLRAAVPIYSVSFEPTVQVAAVRI